MKTKTRHLLVSAQVLIISLCLWGQSAAGPADSHSKIGEIRRIEMSDRTVVVEVPFDGDIPATVGGELTSDARLIRDGRDAALADFAVGDLVRVVWKKTDTGHSIESLEFPVPRSEPFLKDVTLPGRTESVMGKPGRHTIKRKETLLDIAREWDLGFNEIQDFYPGLDPWIPPEGMELIIPSQWVIPEIVQEGIVINVAELRLYLFSKRENLAMTFPIGIGDKDFETPKGVFRISEKRVHPTWYIPPSLQAKYNAKTMPPGPENPLGEYWMGLGDSSYGIHGTDIPWSVGRLVTHGCIRLYPEDIERLFGLVEIGTMVKIIYEPVKIGVSGGKVYVEVHKDIYEKVGDLLSYGYNRLDEKGVTDMVDLEKFQLVIDRRDGMPVDISRAAESPVGISEVVP